jgi:hypothetical protein
MRSTIIYSLENHSLSLPWDPDKSATVSWLREGNWVWRECRTGRRLPVDTVLGCRSWLIRPWLLPFPLVRYVYRYSRQSLATTASVQVTAARRWVDFSTSPDDLGRASAAVQGTWPVRCRTGRQPTGVDAVVAFVVCCCHRRRPFGCTALMADEPLECARLRCRWDWWPDEIDDKMHIWCHISAFIWRYACSLQVWRRRNCWR